VWILFAVFAFTAARRNGLDMARVNAVNSIQKDITYRWWVALHGGVYVPVTKKTPPNPLLADWPHRDAVTATGRKLTLMNPAYMARQVHEWFKTQYGAIGHVTSLKPINPVNAPDPWETAALRTLEKGAREVLSIETVNGEPALRFMHPLATEKGCLKCHEAQGYKEGDIRGGISVVVPLKPYFAAAAVHRDNAWLWGGGIWLLGLAGLRIGYRRVRQVIWQREESAAQLRDAQSRLQLLYDSMLEGMALHEIICDAGGHPCDYRFLRVNPAFERLTGLKAADILGKTVREIFPHFDRKWIERYGPVALEGKPCEFEDYSSDMGRHFHVAAFCPRKGQFAVTFSDITERRKSEEALRHSRAAALNMMEDALAARQRAEAAGEAVEKSERLYRGAIEVAGAVPYYRNAQTHRYDFVGAGVEALTGYPREQFTPEVWEAMALETIPYGDMESMPVEEARRRFWNGEFKKTRVDYHVATRDGTERWIADAAVPVFDAQGQLIGSLGLLQDITDRKRAEGEIRLLNQTLEQRVHERTAQLEASNKELESFCYSVSHDLRAPLRAINGFATILSQDHARQLDDEGRRTLGIVCSEAERMGQLIDDLLEFSRIGRQAMQQTEVDMTRVAQRVFDECAAQAPGRNIQLQLHPLPPALCDPALIPHVWTNLLSNAIKYTRPRNPAVIEIGTAPGGERQKPGDGKENNPASPPPYTTYFVRDNGVGFDMQYAGKLFGVFQRLHSDAEFEGIGVGLALVQRIVLRHGGRVWAESRLGEGATFYFTLPAKPE
jgi:PAS domain S-box-containing protein